MLDACADEVTAFNRFFELLDEYTARKPKVVATFSGLQKTYTVGSEGRERTERYPTRISLIVYTDDPGFFAVSDEPGYSLPGGDEFFPSLDWFETFAGIDRSQLTVTDAKTFERCTGL